jgi:hypothetical protein
MSVIVAAIAAMREKGVDPSAILDIVEAMAKAEATAPRARSANAERQARWRARQTESVTNNVTDNAKTPPPLDPPPKLPRPLNTPPYNPPHQKDSGAGAKAEFESWYERYPHKIGRAVAVKAFAVARRKADLQTLIDGLERYIRTKPSDRAWCNPSTWLNQERWKDRPAVDPPRRNGGGRRNAMMDYALDLHMGGNDDRYGPTDPPGHSEIIPPDRSASGDCGFGRSADFPDPEYAGRSGRDRFDGGPD